MKIFFGTLIVCFVSIAHGNSHQDILIDEDTVAVKIIRKDFENCVNKVKAKKGPEGERRACADEPYIRSQKELDSTYEKALKVLNKKKYDKSLEGALAENELEALSRYQLDFKKYIEAKCLYRSMFKNGGSDQGSVELRCLLELTLDRVNEIQAITLDNP